MNASRRDGWGGAEVAAETAAWVTREMQSADGGYYSTLDADSEGHEGLFYVWDRNQVRRVLALEERIGIRRKTQLRAHRADRRTPAPRDPLHQAPERADDARPDDAKALEPGDRREGRGRRPGRRTRRY